MAGEVMTLDVSGAGAAVGLRVRVIDSRPVMVEGAVRHRIRFTLSDLAREAPEPVRIVAGMPAEAH
jgi:hypothetical protein